MKKLFIYALLLVTGFAFYSCDDRFDNPVTQQQDPSNPAATWTYEVGIKFQQFNNWYADVDGENYTYKAPSTVFVYNKAGEKLGELKALEEFDYDNFNWDSYYKFSGTLKGAIGEELTISTLDGFDYYSKQDGTLKSIIENCILETAEVPIIITNSTKGTIGTQSVQLNCAISTFKARFRGNYSDKSDKIFTFSADSLAYIPTNENGTRSFSVKFAEAIEDPTSSNGFFFTFASEAKENAEFIYEIDSENGYKSICTWNGTYNGRNNIWGTYNLWFDTVKELDLTKYTKFLKDVKEWEEPYNINVSTIQRAKYEPLIYQSSKDTVNVQLYIQGKATIKNLLIGKEGSLSLSGYWDTYENNDPEYQENNYLPVVTLEGDNVVKTNQWQALNIYAEAVLKGEGTLTLTSKSNAIHISSNWWREKHNNEQGWYFSEIMPAKLTLTENVKLISNTRVFIGQTWNYNTQKYMPCTLDVASGTLEAKGGENDCAINLYGGKLTLSDKAEGIKATTGQTGTTPLFIRDDMTGEEVALKDIVGEANVDNFTDKKLEGVRTITPKK